MTSREQDVIALIAAGRSNKEIARELNIAVYTVKSHVHNVLEKLALHSRVEVAAFAYARGWHAEQPRVVEAFAIQDLRVQGGTVFVAIAVILLILWLLGFLVVPVGGSLIHILLVVALIAVIWHFAGGRWAR